MLVQIPPTGLLEASARAVVRERVVLNICIGERERFSPLSRTRDDNESSFKKPVHHAVGSVTSPASSNPVMSAIPEPQKSHGKPSAGTLQFTDGFRNLVAVIIWLLPIISVIWGWQYWILRPILVSSTLCSIALRMCPQSADRG